jgi:hypothetical protein
MMANLDHLGLSADAAVGSGDRADYSGTIVPSADSYFRVARIILASSTTLGG